MISIQNLSKKYPQNDAETLKNINLKFNETGLVYIIGKSGSGKSTFLNILGLMDEEYQGSVKVNNKELKEFSEEEKADYRLKEISFIFQSYRAEEKESVKSNLLKALAITTLEEEEKERRIQYYLNEVGLKDKEDVLFKYLSGGEKKRISIVRSLIKDSHILLCDEPLSNLNGALRKKITKLLKKESETKLVLIITHEKEEIPEDAAIYEIVDSTFVERKKQTEENKETTPCSYDRKQYKGKALYSQIYRNILSKKEFLLITFFSLVIGLFAISFSFQLSSSVSNSMEKSMSSYMDENCLVISQKDSVYNETYFSDPSYAKLLQLKRNHKDMILDISSFYLTTFNPIFGNNQSLEIRFQNKSIPLKKLSLNSFLEYRTIEELDDMQIIYGDKELSDEDVILALDEKTMKGLYSLLFNSSIQSFDEKTLEKLSIQIKNNPVSLRVKANKSEWGYILDDVFKIKGVLLSENSFLVHSSYMFNHSFVTETMHFLETDAYSPIPEEKPWTLRKEDGFRIQKGKSGEFLKSFLYDKDAKDCVLKIFKTPNYYNPLDINTHNHIVVKKDCLGKMHLFEIEDFTSKNSTLIQSVSYSSPVYTYTASGYISGFSKPSFFSKYKEKLNQIQDESIYTDKDLGSFQGSLIEEIPGVLKADLISSMNQKTSLSFITLDSLKSNPAMGEKPSNYNEIGISKKMAEILFQSSNAALNKKLCTLTLNKTTKEKDRYRNHFTQGEIKISAIYDDDRLALYQDSLFPLCYSFALGELSLEETRIQEAVIKVDLNKKSRDYYIKEITNYGEYKGNFPMYTIIMEIKKTLKMLSLLFLGFSILSLISSACLLILAFYLILNKNKKEIGTLLSLGYTKKDISHFYLLFCQVIGFASFLFSLLLSLFTEMTLKKTLMDMLDSYSASIFPYFLSFFISFFITGAIGLLLSLKIKDISPKDAFDSMHQ